MTWTIASSSLDGLSIDNNVIICDYYHTQSRVMHHFVDSDAFFTASELSFSINDRLITACFKYKICFSDTMKPDGEVQNKAAPELVY